MSEEGLRKQLHYAYKHRALLYWHIFDELRQEIGQERAAEILKRAIRKRGKETSGRYAQYGPDDLEGLKGAFVGGSADGGRLFEPQVDRCDAEGLDITHRRCPLKEAWQEAGLSDADCATMCEIAAAVDIGVIEGAGFAFHAETWDPASDDTCCHLHIRPGPPKGA